MIIGAAMLACIALQAILFIRWPVHDFFSTTAWVVIPLWFVWVPLAANGWRRVYMMRERVTVFYDQRARNEERRRPHYHTGFRKLADMARERPRKFETTNALVSVLAGMATVALVRVIGVHPHYPWDVGSFTLGFSGWFLLSELFAYLATAVSYYHALQADPKKDVDHPDEHAGFGFLAEEVNGLLILLFVLVLFGNAFLLSFLQLDYLGVEFDPPEPWLGIPMPTWKQVMFFLSTICTTVVLFTFIGARMAVAEFFERNRRRCIEAWDAERESGADPSLAGKQLKAALALKYQPATLTQTIETSSLAFATILAFSLNVSQVTGQGLLDFVKLFLG